MRTEALGLGNEVFDRIFVVGISVVFESSVQEILGPQGVDNEVLHGPDPQGDAGFDTIDMNDGGILFTRGWHCVEQGS